MEYISLSEQAYNIIEQKIVTLELQPGQFITQKEISQDINIGQIPVREAFIKLKLAHLVNILPRKGIVVAPIIWSEAFQQIEIRKAIEPLLMMSASFNSTEKEREKFRFLREEYKSAMDTKDLNGLFRIDGEFHNHVVESAHNSLLRYCILPLWALARRMYYANYAMDDNLSHKMDEAHCAIMDAIYKQNESDIKMHSLNMINDIEILYKKTFSLQSYKVYSKDNDLEYKIVEN